jgi:hypothetical protein
MNKSYDVYMCRCSKRAETERQLADDELLRSSPFDMMPSKLEKRGMMEIFKREYFGRFESEK